MCFLGAFGIQGCLAVWAVCCWLRVEAGGWARWKAEGETAASTEGWGPNSAPLEPSLIAQPPRILKGNNCQTKRFG